MADITFLSAGIGGGKSRLASQFLCEELLRSDRFIVTNLPIYVDDAPPYTDSSKPFDSAAFQVPPRERKEGDLLTIQEWVQKYSPRPIDTTKRLRLLTREEVFEFWRYIPGAVTLPLMERSTASGGKETVTNLDLRAMGASMPYSGIGCLYIIDEVHLFFGARDWARIGNSVEFYMSQLRKCNDDLILISQHPEKVDKNFRRNATEWTYLTNMGKVRGWLGVSLPKRFRFATYLQMPTRGDKPMVTGWFRLDEREYHKVYNTMAGVGLSGKMLPEGSRFTGRHWSVYLIAAVAILALAYAVPRVGTKILGRFVGGMMSSFQQGAKKSLGGYAPTNSLPPVPSPALPRPGRKTVSTAASAPAVEDPDEGVAMVAIVKMPDRWLVFLSDGRKLESTDPEFEVLTQNGVKYAGKYYHRVLASHTQKDVVTLAAPASAPVSKTFEPAESSSRPQEVSVHWAGGGVTHHHLTDAVASE